MARGPIERPGPYGPANCEKGATFGESLGSFSACRRQGKLSW